MRGLGDSSRRLPPQCSTLSFPSLRRRDSRYYTHHSNNGEDNIVAISVKGISCHVVFFVFTPLNIDYSETVALVMSVQVRGGCIILIVFVLEKPITVTYRTKWLPRRRDCRRQCRQWQR